MLLAATTTAAAAFLALTATLLLSGATFTLLGRAVPRLALALLATLFACAVAWFKPALSLATLALEAAALTILAALFATLAATLGRASPAFLAFPPSCFSVLAASLMYLRAPPEMTELGIRAKKDARAPPAWTTASPVFVFLSSVTAVATISARDLEFLSKTAAAFWSCVPMFLRLVEATPAALTAATPAFFALATTAFAAGLGLTLTGLLLLAGELPKSPNISYILCLEKNETA